MTVLVNSPWPSGTETYSSAQAQTQHPQLHHAKRAQSISAWGQQDSHIPTVFTWVGNAGRTPCSFHASWQKLTHLRQHRSACPQISAIEDAPRPELYSWHTAIYGKVFICISWSSVLPQLSKISMSHLSCLAAALPHLGLVQQWSVP